MASIKKPSKKQREKVLYTAATKEQLERAKYVYEHESCLPPISNTGGNYDNCGLILDTLSITGKFEEIPSSMAFTDEDYVNELMSYVQLNLGLSIEYRDSGGKNGYQHSRMMCYTDDRPYKNLGYVAWGGNRGSFQFYFTGECCEYLGMNDLFPKLRSFVEKNAMKLKRIDIAYDDYEGEYDIESAISFYEAGLFKISRNPSIRQVGDFVSGKDTKGRTVYIGNRKNGKMMRIYEKGKQLGNESSPWVRWEVELKAVDREIPTSALTEYAGIFAGSYPVLKNFVEAAVTVVKTKVKKTAQISVDVAADWLKTTGGKTLNVIRALWSKTMSDTEILDALTREGQPKRLVFPLPVVSVSMSEDVLTNPLGNDPISLSLRFEDESS
jgi:phage replication initiation protein